MENITLTDSAAARIYTLLREEANPELKLRAFVQGGGCSGLTYGFTFDVAQNDDDFVIRNGDTILLVDAMSYQYLQGATIDYKDDLSGSRFTINNPNSVATCGCGSSFSVG